ncbi:MAG: hypothetical protein ACE5JG_08325, partial [Planctomycetota bacterium]
GQHRLCRGAAPALGGRALALAVGVGQAVNLAVLLLGARRWGAGWTGASWGFFARIAAATAVCAAAAAGASLLLPVGPGLGSRLAAALVPVAAGAAAYLLAGRALGCPEILAAGRLLRGRFDGSQEPP